MSVAVASDRWRSPDDAVPRHQGQPSAHLSGEVSPPTPLIRGRVLVVDDSPSLRETLSDVLTVNGYRVETAEDGIVALERMAQSSFDVVILDLAMPRLDGIELLRRVQEPHPSMVICSAFEYYTPEQVEEAAGAKVFRSLRKPVPPDVLVSAVAEAMATGRGPGHT